MLASRAPSPFRTTPWRATARGFLQAMDGDVAAERQLNVVERLLVRMPRDRGFRIFTSLVSL